LKEDLLRKLVRFMKEEGLTELEIRTWGRHIRLVRGAPAQGPPTPVLQEGREEAPEDRLYTIRAPMVGTFYRAPAPDAEPFVKEGDRVKAGQTVCIIEGMKIMNEIESEVEGTIVKVLAENAKPVEYGQELFLVRLD